MKLNMNKNIPFQTIDWETVPRTEYKGETGTAYWQTVQDGSSSHRSYTKDGVKVMIIDGDLLKQVDE
jgi:hypothetical protein